VLGEGGEVVKRHGRGGYAAAQRHGEAERRGAALDLGWDCGVVQVRRKGWPGVFKEGWARFSAPGDGR